MILIIDDDVPFGSALERMFRYSGFDSVFTPNPLEALSLLHIRKPRLVILDITMPIMDGMTVLKAIRQDAEYDAVPVLVYSSDFSKITQSHALEAGAQAYIVKGTLGWESLLARIRKFLADSGTPLRIVQ